MSHFLVVKTSSLGDIIHNFPAITDLRENFPQANIDWVVEENYSVLPSLHPNVSQTISVSLRRWRREFRLPETYREISTFLSALRRKKYDAIIDTQGLFKSALISRIARGPSFGLDRSSAREPVAYFYNKRLKVDKKNHAVDRNRSLAALSMGYQIKKKARFGLTLSKVNLAPVLDISKPYAILLPFSSRKDKSWSFQDWISTGNLLTALGLRCVLLVGNDSDYSTANQLVGKIQDSIVYPISPLDIVSSVLLHATLVLGVDTGLTHLAAALKRPTIGIFLATDPQKTGLYGSENIVNLGGVDETVALHDISKSLGKLVPEFT